MTANELVQKTALHFQEEMEEAIEEKKYPDDVYYKIKGKMEIILYMFSLLEEQA